MHGGFKPLTNPATPRLSDEELEATREERDIARDIIRSRNERLSDL